MNYDSVNSPKAREAGAFFGTGA